MSLHPGAVAIDRCWVGRYPDKFTDNGETYMDTKLPPHSAIPSYDSDWLLDSSAYRAGLFNGAHPEEIVLSNGLLSRTFRLGPNAATVGLDSGVNGTALLRGIKPEARIQVDGTSCDIGGLIGQEEYAYLRREWIDSFKCDPAAFRHAHYEHGPTQAPFAWKRVRHAPDLPWPAPGVRLSLHFAAPADSGLEGLEAVVHYELYDGIPLLCKWLEMHNHTGRSIRLNTFVSEILAAVEGEISVDSPSQWTYPDIHVESDYAFHGMTTKSANATTFWCEDPQYQTQVNYLYKTPCLLESRPPLGPEIDIEDGAQFESFRTFLLLPDSQERERRGLALRRMYRTLAPWSGENPILMHVRHSDPEAVKTAIDQCAEVGFEMVIMTFGSGFNAESDDPEYIEGLRDLADYAHAKGIELGGYSLLASRSINDEDDVIHPETGQPGGAIFGDSPCLGSIWGQQYFQRLETLYAEAGLDILEHDGSYPGDVCASQDHPGHRDLGDSQWQQWQRIVRFYRWCRERGIYLNVPDWYFLNGSNKNGMGYREVNWSLPRERQILLARQNMYDGTWEKNPSMGWMFVPLVEYHGGGEAATLEPLSEHLEAYGAHLAQNLGWGVQACYRGPRLYDTEQTKAVVREWISFYKAHRAILESDVIHLRRADGCDLDGIVHVNPQLTTCALIMVFNPLETEVVRTWKIPLYYAGIEHRARVSERGGSQAIYALNRAYEIELEMLVPARGVNWYAVEDVT